jgi:glycyl-tRNA synthetase
MRGDTLTIAKALETGILQNETIAYFIGRTALFAQKIGLKEGKFRFRQHKAKEMAHYAQDCWDLEALTSYGWVECIGIADRSAFDLTVHSKATGVRLQVFKPYDKPIQITRLLANPDKGLLGKAFKKEGKGITTALAALDNEAVAALQKTMESEGKADITTAEGKTFNLTSDMIKFKEGKEKKTGDFVVPHVIEPSFGVGRLLYSIWEQSFYIRQYKEKKKIEDQRGVLSLSPAVAPTTCLVVPLMVKQELLPTTKKVVKILSRAGISHSEDCSGAAVGRRYARADEIGIPFALTIDYDTLEDQTVTLRERDSMKQVRVQVDSIQTILKDLTEGHLSWENVMAQYPHHETKE